MRVPLPVCDCVCEVTSLLSRGQKFYYYDFFVVLPYAACRSRAREGVVVLPYAACRSRGRNVTVGAK